MLFATTFTVAKACVLYMDPLFFIGIRMSIAGIAFLGYQYIHNKHQKWPKKEDAYLFVQLILFHVFFAYILEFWALQYVTSYKTALIFNASPFITALLAYTLFKEKVTIRQWIGLSIGFIGFLPILIPSIAQERAIGSIGFFSYPELALIMAVTSSCYGWMIFKQLVVYRDYSPIAVNGVGMTVGGVLALMVWALSVGGMPLNPAFPWHIALSKSVMYMGILIIIANTICYNLYGFLLKKYSTTFLSFAGCITPLFSALFGSLFLKEPLTWHFVCAIFIICSGLFIFYQDELLSKKQF